MRPERHGLPKRTHLKQQRLIRPLFDRRRTDVITVASGCVRLVARRVSRSSTGGVPVLVGFTPGRGSRRAVDRNQVKRYLREVYRRHQHPLVDLFACTSGALTLMVLFRGRADQAQSCIARDLPRALAHLHERLAPSAGEATGRE